MANDFGILLQTRLNTQNAQKAYETWKSSIQKKPINLDMTINSNGLKNLKTELGSIQTQIDNFSNTTAANFNKMTKAVEVVTTQTDKYKLANDGLRTVITKTNDAGQQFRTIIDKVVDGQGRLVTTTQNLTQEQKGSLKYWTQFGNKITEITADYAKAETEEGKLRQSLAETNNLLNQTQSAGNNAAVGLNNVSHASQTLAQRITTAAGKVALFKVSTTIVMAFYNAISDARDRVVEYDKSLTELKKVWDDAYGSLDRLSNKLSEIGKETANTLTNMTDIATGIVKAGYSSEEDIAIMSEYVAKLQNTADEELTAAEATSILVSQLKAYHMEASEASKVTDILNAVSAQQAVSSGDLSKALTVGSASMATYGNTIEQTTALEL